MIVYLPKHNLWLLIRYHGHVPCVLKFQEVFVILKLFFLLNEIINIFNLSHLFLSVLLLFCGVYKIIFFKSSEVIKSFWEEKTQNFNMVQTGIWSSATVGLRGEVMSSEKEEVAVDWWSWGMPWGGSMIWNGAWKLEDIVWWEIVLPGPLMLLHVLLVCQECKALTAFYQVISQGCVCSNLPWEKKISLS